jgi:hypothetical protein
MFGILQVFLLLAFLGGANGIEGSSVVPIRLPTDKFALATIESLVERGEEERGDVMPAPLEAIAAGTAPVYCIFKSLSTGKTEIQVVSAEQQQNREERIAAGSQFEQILDSLRGQCIRNDRALPGAYIYEVCVNDRVNQISDGGNFVLGRLSRRNDENDAGALNVQQYTEGDMCSTQSRTATVIWVCGQQFAVISAEESVMCRYAITASSPLICDLPRKFFPGAAAPLDETVSENLPPKYLEAYRQLTRPVEQPAPNDGLSTADVPGIGGRSIGVDDRYRGSKTWTGIHPGTVTSWALSLTHEVHSGEKSGEVRGGVHSKLRAPAGIAAAHASVTCSLFATDELRKSGGAVGKGSDGSASVASENALNSFALFIVAANNANGHLVRSSARGFNRRGVPVLEGDSQEAGVLALSPEECKAQELLSGLGPTYDRLTRGMTCWGGLYAPVSSPGDLEFSSITVQLDI